jgi:asparagine synthase (glutamine-hydrolysing)
MCSVTALLDLPPGGHESLRHRALAMSRAQRHRGPDWSGIFDCPGAILAHERLSIVDVEHGAQPLYNAARTRVLAVNGEIYNHREIRARLQDRYDFQTGSDCEVILALHAEKGADFLDELNGIFAFVLYDRETDRYLVGRDHLGIVPLYTGRDAAGTLHVASELKALVPFCETVEEFPPGHVLEGPGGAPRRWYRRDWEDYANVQGAGGGPGAIREALEAAVRRQLMSDVPYGVLLSGGLDSSVISAVARRLAPRRIEDDGRSEAWWPQLHSFAIGLPGSPDLAAARDVAAHIGSVHHEFRYTIQEGLDALRDVLWHIESCDVTTVRASTPMFLMARRIRAMGIKMVLSGEGADEVFGGYLYFHKAPDARAFHEETVRKVFRLHRFDCLRANKSMAAWGVEARVPFLDKEFLDVAMAMDPALKTVQPGGIEKRVLREAFQDLLPAKIAWRQKEQFSDGVGYGWIDSLREHAAREVSDLDFAAAAERFPLNPPATKEAFLYRRIFEELFPLPSAVACVAAGPSVACSTPEALAWDPALSAVVDPSGRAVRGVHRDGY